MPRQENNIVCPNDNNIMSAPDGFHALTQVTRQGDNINFNPASGIPLKVFICRQCGYIETYHAESTAEWRE